MDDNAYEDSEEDEENVLHQLWEKQQTHVKHITFQGTDRYILVAALHFGPMFTKCVWSLRDVFERNPLQFYMNLNLTKEHHDKPLAYQTCAILLDKNKKLICFGDEAEIEYADICLNGNEDDFYLFSQFTTKLKNKKNISRDMMLADVTGKPLLACFVFELYIKALTTHLKDAWGKRKAVENNEIRWVLAISADVSESGKRFIRSCFEQAGIPADQCMLVTESEAAFSFCLKLLEIDHNQTFQDGKDYMIVNLEDYSADIIVVRKENYHLIEQYRKKCDDFVSTSMNERFVEFLDEIIGKPVIQSYKYKYATEYNDIIRAMTYIKKQIGENEKGIFSITLPFVYLDNISHETRKKDFKFLVESSIFSEKVKVMSDKMRIDNEIFRNLAKPTIDKVISFLEMVFKEYKNVTDEMDIVIVGGFADYKLLQEVVRQKFFTKRIIFPKSPELAVVKGAVLCGSEPYQYIRSLSSEEMSESILANLSQLNKDDFKDLVALGTFASYENRVYLAGPCNSGKSSLASILIGETIPRKWFSTDGLIIHFGRNGIDLLHRKMIPLKKGAGGVLTKLLLGNPELNEQHGMKDEAQDASLQNLKIDPLRPKKQHGKTISTSKQTPPDGHLKLPPEPDASKIKRNNKKKKGEVQDESNQNFRKMGNPSDGRPKLIYKPDLKTLKAFQKQPIHTAHSIQQDILDKIKKRSYVMNIAPSDLVDFGGQKSFDMTHQLFIQHKGTFILMFDGRKGLNTELDEYPQGNVTAGSILEHWINSVLTYCNKSDDDMPRIIFAATHGDMFSKEKKEELSLLFQEELTRMFSSHKLHNHIVYDKIFFINATDAADLNIDRLKHTLVDIAFEQSTWGQRMPIVWVPLDLQISDLRFNGLKIITKKRLLEINKSNGEFALTERRVEDFLLVQHSIGKLLYFDEPSLRDFIVIQPTAMVNILRAFITDRMFWPEEGAIRNILENLASTGVLKKTDLFSLWSQPAFKDILRDDKTKEYTVQMLLHLDILVEPKRYTEKDIASELFLVPCMVKEKIPQKLQKTETDENTICIAYHLKDTVVPSALSFKLIGAAISIWPLKVIDDRFCLYFQAAIMDANDKNELHIYVEGQRIVACLRNEVSKQFISPDLATTTQECLTLALERILQFYRRSFGTKESKTNSDLMEVEIGEICNGETCLIPLVDAKKLPHWCCRSKNEHETKIPLNWVFDKNQDHCDPKCQGLKPETLVLRPNDQHFVQLERTIGISDFYNFFIHLGMVKSDYDNLNFRYFSNPMDFMLMGLFEWRDKTESDTAVASFEDLQKALSAIERQHYLCQVCREDHSLVEIAQNRLQDIPPDHVINMLTDRKMIGDCVVHLGVELGLSIGNIKETMHNFPRDLNGQIHDLFVKWTNWVNSNRSKPTIYRLMVVLKRIKAAEGLAFVKSTYDVE